MVKKLVIENLDKKGSPPIEVMYNPAEYTVEGNAKWQEQPLNRKKPSLQYTGSDIRKLSLDLFFDSYENKEDVRTYTSKLGQLLIPSINTNDGKRPPKLQIRWGKGDPDPSTALFPFVCVMETLKQQFTLFDNEGTPVRAKVTASFKEFRDPREEEQRNPTSSSSPAQTYTVREGDTLSSIAGEVWHDPTLWRKIASANEILNPRSVKPGQQLILPKID
jgi:hypothetical protein